MKDRIKKAWRWVKSQAKRFWDFVVNLITKDRSGDYDFNEWITEVDFLDLGFEKIEENTKYKDFMKGNLTLKWGYRPSMRTLSIKWGKSPRFFGVCETKRDLVYLLILIEKYFKR